MNCYMSIYNDNLPSRAIAVYMYLIQRANSDGQCWPSERRIALDLSISKSTVHKDLCEVLPRTSPALFAQIRKLLEQNKAQRHIRGGLATRRKYEEKKGMR